MPCDQIRSISVDLGKVNKDLLSAAMNHLSIRAWTLEGSTLTIRGYAADEDTVAQVKREYSRQVVLSQAKKFGWQMKEIAPNKWEVLRR